MGIYTIHNDPLIDQQIESRLNKIVDILVKNLPNVQSIILTGGFGKGEGSVRISNGRVTPLRDFDLVVVFKKSIPRREVTKVQRMLSCESNAIENYKYNQEFCLDISATTLDNINLFPDAITYDFKASKVIYGIDLRSKIKWDSKEIPLRSGARLLFNKSTALLGSFSLNYLTGRIEKTKVDVFLA